MAFDVAAYRHWLKIAHRFAPTEADDLLQTCLLIAVEQQRLDFEDESNRKWFTGVLRNQARMTARSQRRRQQREEQSTRPESHPPTAFASIHDRLLDRLTPATKQVAILALAGLDRDETCHLLALSATAFRQRLTAIRRALRTLPPDLQQEALALAYHRQAQHADSLMLGLIRRALLHWLQHEGELGTHDPDGHLLVIKLKK